VAAVNPIDAYLASVDPEKRPALERIRALAHEIVPGACETISYRMPTLTFAGKPFLGFAARANHIGIYPFSGRVLPALHDELGDYAYSRGALRVPYDRPLTKALLKKIVRLSRALSAE
jgi:uncharacterized protein YdhG (YjbR/CyaY superfamily)